MYELRDYQKQQLNFVQDHLEVSNVVGLQSPTGSGKTVVILKLAEMWMNDEKNAFTNVVISTGFNHLVFLMEKRAIEMGMKPIVLIGSASVNCPLEWEERMPGKEYKVFDADRSGVCGTKHYSLDTEHTDGEKCCPFTLNAYRAQLSEIQKGGRLVIVNHSTFLAHQQNGLWDNMSLLMVDEAHTFGSYYESYLKLELDRNDMQMLDDAINKTKKPFPMIIKSNISQNRQLPQQQIEAVVEQIKNRGLKMRVKEFFETPRGIGNWVEIGPWGYQMTKFYHRFDILSKKTLIVSATLDSFTRECFGLRVSHMYRENRQMIEYEKSELLIVHGDEYLSQLKRFLSHCSKMGRNTGLILSTTISDMKIALNEAQGYEGYKLFDDVGKWELWKHHHPDGKSALVGSRALFQGVDFDDLQFVCINKIPFPLYDDKCRANQEYLTQCNRNGFDAWNGFIVPKTENDLIQSTGRLWRSAESYGTVGVFDSRLSGRFSYMIKHCFEMYRHGIKVLQMKEDGSIEG